jgi:RNA polymerase sigma-B factor
MIDPESDAPSLVHVLGTEDPEIEGVENRESLKPLVQALPDREKRLLEMRFFQGMTQSQIATELGISQMHVSRLLSRTLGQLRESLLDPQ